LGIERGVARLGVKGKTGEWVEGWGLIWELEIGVWEWGGKLDWELGSGWRLGIRS
jgi:hypothetical protein